MRVSKRQAAALEAGQPVPMTEEEFQRIVIEYARIRGWLVAHFRPGRTKNGEWRTAVSGDGKGWPDLFLVRGTKAFAIEVKADGREPFWEQGRWLAALQSAGIEALCVHPSDWPAIRKLLEAP